MKAIPSLSLFRSSIPLSLYCQLHRVERALHLLLLLESFSHSFFVYPGPSLRWRKSFLEVRKEEERRKTKPKPKRRRKTVASSISSRTVAVQRLVNSSYFGGVVAQRKSKSERKSKNRLSLSRLAVKSDWIVYVVPSVVVVVVVLLLLDVVVVAGQWVHPFASFAQGKKSTTCT